MRAAFLICVAAVMVAACGAQVAQVSSGSRTTSPAPIGSTGTITGRLSYPSEFLPGQAVYAMAVDGSSYHKVETVTNQAAYTIMNVPAGDYFVFAVARFGSVQDRFAAGYTKAVPCGLAVSCTDHSPLRVHVDAGHRTPGINPSDWYAEPDQFPLIPDGPTSIPAQPLADFDSSEAAGRSLGETRLTGRYVSSPADCPRGIACFWVVSKIDGHNATYFVAYAGSNEDLIRCALYTVQEGDRWRQLDVRCNQAEQGVFPGLHERGHVALGMGETGCVRVHSSPGLTARVVGCLNPETTVILDDGPYYLPTAASSRPNGPSQLDVWWHLTGSGWMVHQYLR